MSKPGRLVRRRSVGAGNPARGLKVIGPCPCCGMPAVSSWNDHRPERKRDVHLPVQAHVSHAPAVRPAPLRLQLIKEYRPAVVVLTPSYALTLGRQARAEGFDLAGFGVRGLLLGGETFPDCSDRCRAMDEGVLAAGLDYRQNPDTPERP